MGIRVEVAPLSDVTQQCLRSLGNRYRAGSDLDDPRTRSLAHQGVRAGGARGSDRVYVCQAAAFPRDRLARRRFHSVPAGTNLLLYPAGLLICGALVILAFFITQRIIPLGFLLTRDSLSIALAILMIGFFTMIARKKAVTQVIGFLVMENGLFLGATVAAHGMPLIVELGVFFDVLVATLIIGIYTHRLQDAFDSVDTSKLTVLKE